MANMSYCRFENTVRDLRDCRDHMEEEMSKSEREARIKLLQLCKEIAEHFVEEDFEADDLDEMDAPK